MAYEKVERKAPEQSQKVKWENIEGNKGVYLGPKLEGYLMTKRVIEIEGKPVKVYDVQVEAGETYTVFGNKVLNGLLEDVGLGFKICIDYLGKRQVKGKAYKYNDFEVQVDKEDCIPVQDGDETVPTEGQTEPF